MPDDKYEALRKAAEAAGRDCWNSYGDFVYCTNLSIARCLGDALHPRGTPVTSQDQSRYIALANPATILALLAERDALAKKAARYDWIRDATLSGDETYIDALRAGVPDAIRKGLRDATPTEYDAAIDAAIAAQQKEG